MVKFATSKSRKERMVIMDEKEKAYQEKLDEEKRNSQAACKHERTRKEYIGGMDTGDRICMDCGKTI